MKLKIKAAELLTESFNITDERMDILEAYMRAVTHQYFVSKEMVTIPKMCQDFCTIAETVEEVAYLCAKAGRIYESL